MKRKWAFFVFLSGFFYAISLNSFAGTGGGTIKQVVAIQGGVVIFKLETQDGAPSCVRLPREWAIDTSQPAGKAILALLLTAINQGKAVSVTGSGACEVWGDRETAAQLWINY